MRINKRKWAALAVTGLFLTVMISAGCAERKIANINSKGKNIICFGDSLTFGYGVEPGGDYPAALSKMTSLPVINAGIDGDTSSEALRRLESDVLDRDPLLVIIEFGGNDFLRKIPEKVTVENMKKMVEQIQARGAMVAVVDISTTFIMREYYSPFFELAREKGAIFIPKALNGIITNPRMKSDFIHPNANGYALISQRVYRAITPYLIKNNLLRKI